MRNKKDKMRKIIKTLQALTSDIEPLGKYKNCKYKIKNIKFHNFFI